MSVSCSSPTESSKKCSGAPSDVLIWDKHAEYAQSNLKLGVTDETHCDVVFITRFDDKRIPAHRVILHMTSLYFRTMFDGKFRESSEKEIVIDDMRSDILKLIIEFCYYGKIVITVDNVEELLRAAELMQFKMISKGCAEFMLRNLDGSNCLGIAQFLKPYEFPLISDKVTKCEEYLKLKIDDLTELLSRPNIVVDSEDALFMALKTWVQHDWDNRQSYVPKLLDLINLKKLSKECFLNEAVRWLGLNAPFVEIFASVMEYHLLSENVKPNLGMGQNSAIRSDTSQLISVSFNRATTKISIKMYNSDGTWELLSEKPKNSFYRSTITHSENKIFVLDNGNKFEYFDVIEKEWIHLSSTFRYHDELTLAYYKGQVYGMGPCSCKTMNIYTKSMTSISPMKYPRFGAGIGVVDDKMYLIGGQLSENGISCNKVENYEPERDIWTECPSLTTSLTFCDEFIFPNVVFFAGYLYSIQVNGKVGRYKPGDDHWELIAPLPLGVPRNGYVAISACVYKNSIIAVCRPPPTNKNKWFKYNEPENKWNEVVDISNSDDENILHLFCVDRNNIKS